MNRALHWVVDRSLRYSGLQYLPVRVRRGLPAGARWTLYPWTSYWRGGYEPAMERGILSLGDLRGKVCWDLGAHIGYYSVGLALKVGPSGEVAAFEPFPNNFARLERHRRMNDLTWLKTFQRAVSDQSGTSEFILSVGDTVHHLAYDGEVPTATTQTIPIHTVQLDALVAAGEIRLPDFMKIDVEGHGHRALAGAMDSIARSRPTIIMGFHSPQEVDGTHALLDPLGYRWTNLQDPQSSRVIGCDFLLHPQAR